jgi:hypothetical protein
LFWVAGLQALASQALWKATKLSLGVTPTSGRLRDANDMSACTTISHFCFQGLSAPTLQSALNYLLLALVYARLRFGRGAPRSLAKPWYYYALLALLDVEANFCLVRAQACSRLLGGAVLYCGYELRI